MGGQSLPWLRSGTRLAKASLDPGEATGWDVGDPILTCSLPPVFLPKSFHQPLFCPTLRLSSPTYPKSFKQALLPTQSSFQPSLQLPTRCLSRLHVFMNSSPAQFFHTPKTSPENQEEWREKEGDLMEVFKSWRENTKSRNFMETTSHYPEPIVFQQGGDE